MDGYLYPLTFVAIIFKHREATNTVNEMVTKGTGFQRIGRCKQLNIYSGTEVNFRFIFRVPLKQQAFDQIVGVDNAGKLAGRLRKLQKLNFPILDNFHAVFL
ncbi:hypothetical protein MTE1_5061 [Klebsiella pneumoniae JHCK1]|nr:hypothetical protein MTE1_5061 [Klebsiella pneumoniae JHCK1]